MNQTTSLQYQRFVQSFDHLEWLTENQDVAAYIQLSIQAHDFKQHFERICTQHDYSGRSVLSLCEPILYDLSKRQPPDDWLAYCYQVVLKRAYPSSIEIEFSPQFELAAELFIHFFRFFCEVEKETERAPFDYRLDFLPVEDEMIINRHEYRKFVAAFDHDMVYELMKLHFELTRHNNIHHISGVHSLAVHIGRQCFQLGIPVDLGVVSGAAASHDIGKFGCTGECLQRVPYFHYFYTDEWTKRHDLLYIGHIATNHSTWDLELENLPLESLLLIYCDFRVKNRILPDGERHMHIFSLDEAFDIILNKLDNVDETKANRYRKVYAKLNDFESFLRDQNVNLNLEHVPQEPAPTRHYALMHHQEVIKNIKFMAIRHNIDLMHNFRSVGSLSSILEQARSESDPQKLRGYLQVLEEYTTYLTQDQKLITIQFLYDLLTNKDGDIRRQAAGIIGMLIANFDEEYRKEIPRNANLPKTLYGSDELLNSYIQKILHPDPQLIEQHQIWITHNLRVMLATLFQYAKKGQLDAYRKIVLSNYTKANFSIFRTKFYLMQIIKRIPMKNFDESVMIQPLRLLLGALTDPERIIRITALERIWNLVNKVPNQGWFIDELKRILKRKVDASKDPAENYLRFKLAERIRVPKTVVEHYYAICRVDGEDLSDIYLQNLKTATPWVFKKVHVHLLADFLIAGFPNIDKIHTAIHFCNLLKVSEVENVRNHAGIALVEIFPYLSKEQKNDVTVELLRALEMENFQFTNFIPRYLGKVMLHLQPRELDEIINDFVEKTKVSNQQIAVLLLKTIGVCMQNYAQYGPRFQETEEVLKRRLVQMVSILLSSFVNFDQEVKREAFLVLGKDVFGSNKLNMNEKQNLLSIVAKKMLVLAATGRRTDLLRLNDSVSLNHIYRFIADYEFSNREVPVFTNQKKAFFPGTFDPFSISHKKIAENIRNMGYEVFLAVDEFSWSKRTQPNMIRRNIIDMSIADELNIYLFPSSLSVNIANQTDLKELQNCYGEDPISIVVGSDVILHASAYATTDEFSIFDFPHVIFERNCDKVDPDPLKPFLDRMKEPAVRLCLPEEYEDISSTQIRKYIDQNRDVSMMIDPLAQKYIMARGFYRHEPQMKSPVSTRTLKFEIIEEFRYETISELRSQFGNFPIDLKSFFTLDSARLLIARETKGDTIVGAVPFRWLRNSMIFREFHDHTAADFIRQKAVGRIALIAGIYTHTGSPYRHLGQILLTETLSFTLQKDYTSAVYHEPLHHPAIDERNYKILKLQGFVPVPQESEEAESPIYLVSMTHPSTLYLNMKALLKEPYRNNPKVIRAIHKSRDALREAMVALYPGQLLLTVDRKIMNEKLMEIICRNNHVDLVQGPIRTLGPNLCVPYGSILKGRIVPNTATKTLHTEKTYKGDATSFYIHQTPYYLSLDEQIRMLKSFKRPVLLIDDILHKGYRIKAIQPKFSLHDVRVEKTIVGILSSQGQELMELQELDVESAYFVPNLNVWFNESILYPFIGGDAVERMTDYKSNMIPSVNFILPYASPSYIKEAPVSAIYKLSETVLKNTYQIFRTLEREYQRFNDRALCITNLGEIFSAPRFPDRSDLLEYDSSLKVSEYIAYDQAHLKRIQSLFTQEEK
jgi:nicotinic acid mononucleotide adenylyltransferase